MTYVLLVSSGGLCTIHTMLSTTFTYTLHIHHRPTANTDYIYGTSTHLPYVRHTKMLMLYGMVGVIEYDNCNQFHISAYVVHRIKIDCWGFSLYHCVQSCVYKLCWTSECSVINHFECRSVINNTKYFIFICDICNLCTGSKKF